MKINLHNIMFNFQNQYVRTLTIADKIYLNDIFASPVDIKWKI